MLVKCMKFNSVPKFLWQPDDFPRNFRTGLVDGSWLQMTATHVAHDMTKCIKLERIQPRPSMPCPMPSLRSFLIFHWKHSHVCGHTKFWRIESWSMYEILLRTEAPSGQHTTFLHVRKFLRLQYQVFVKDDMQIRAQIRVIWRLRRIKCWGS